MPFISFAGTLKRDGSVEVLYAGTDGAAAVEAMEKAFTEVDPAEVAEIHCVRNAQPFARRFLEEPVKPKPAEDEKQPKAQKASKQPKAPKQEKPAQAPKDEQPAEQEQPPANPEADPFA